MPAPAKKSARRKASGRATSKRATSRAGPRDPDLRIRLLGEIEVWRDGERVALPQSKKTRALLAYLVMAERPLRRERLCELLWDVADDPRAALRWSLSRLRRLLEVDGKTRIVADRASVAFELEGAWVDAFAVRRRLPAAAGELPADDLAELAGEFRGEFAEGLELSEFHDFQAWCVAEREQMRRTQVRILRELVDRLGTSPERALPHARRLVQVEPVDEAARARLLGLLAETGRHREAEQQYRSGERLLDELAAERSGELRRAWDAIRGKGTRRRDESSEATPEPLGARAPAGDEAEPPLVGRDAEREKMGEVLDEVGRSRRMRALLVKGEPGIGKSRLLAELRVMARARGGTVFAGAAFEVEAARPYGPWIDALRDEPPQERLAPLFPERSGAETSESTTRERLFAAVDDLFDEAARNRSPVLLTLDDVQWCDDASTALLHYVGRMSRSRPVLVALAARSGELLDNTPMSRTLGAFRRDGHLTEMRIAGLDATATESLLRERLSEADAARAFARSGGNPLFALEIARAGPGDGSGLAGTLNEIVRDRLDRLPLDAADLLRWGAILGGRFGMTELRRISSLEDEALVSALETLERHSLLVPAGPDAASYAFAHDVVRGAVYGDLSEPRRRLMHTRVTEVFASAAEGDGSAAAQVAHHAGLAGDPGRAAVACVAAGHHCLRVFANREAESFARRGLRHAEQLEDPQSARLSLELWEVSLTARRPEEVESAAERLESLAERAHDHGCMEHARLGFHLLAHLSWEEGEWSDAQRQMMRAELAGRSTDPGERAVALAEAARCLVMIERDLGRAEALSLESRALARTSGRRPLAVALSIGMLRFHQGQLDEAVGLFEEARSLCIRERDHLGEFQALEQLVLVQMQRGRWDETALLSADLSHIGERIREGSEAPFGRALDALARYARGDDHVGGEIEVAVERLREVDAKYRLACALRRAAEIDLERGAPDRARRRATEALEAASLLDRPSETALARVVLARAAASLGDRDALERQLSALGDDGLQNASAEARSAVEALLVAHEPTDV